MADVALTAGIRANLMALQNTKYSITQTQNRLSTGLSVSSAADDAVKYFQAKSLSDRAQDLSARKDAIDQGVSTVTTASNALSSLESLLKQMKGILDNTRSGTSDQRKAYASQLKTLTQQMARLVNDSSYNGMNLINSSASSLTIYFSEKSSAKLQVQGVNMQASKLFLSSSGGALGISGNGSNFLSKFGLIAVRQTDRKCAAAFTKLQNGGFSALSGIKLSKASVLAAFNSKVDTAQTYLDKTIQNVRAQAATMGANVAILQVRLDFTKSYINTLQGGSDKLTVADLNQESASLVALQTRQQLGIQALSMANQSDQAILSLFR